MKKFYFILFILSYIPFINSQWITLNGNTTETLTCTKFINSNTGWVTGDHGKILKTMDGGLTWSSKQLDTQQKLLAIGYKSDNILIAGGGPGLLFKSTDGGNSWASRTSATTEAIRTIFYAGESTWYAAGGNYGGFVSKSTNDGETWTANDITASSIITSIYFIDKSTGYACCTTGQILKTTNGGTNWNYQQSNTPQWLYGIYFVDANEGWVVGGNVNTEFISHTTNGGSTWLQQSQSYQGQWLNSVQFFDRFNGIAVGGDEYHYYNSYVFTTTDGGYSWKCNYLSNKEALYSVSMVNADSGFIVGSNGLILKKRAFWLQQNSNSANSFNAVAVKDSNRIWTVGSNGDIKFSSNFGDDWQTLSSGTNQELTSIDLINGKGWIAGHGGTILYSPEEGMTWTVKPSGSTADLTSIMFFNDSTGIACGNGILRTTNAGTNWNTITNPSGRTIRSISKVDNNTCYAAGGNFGSQAAVLKSTDKGASWISIYFPGSLEIITAIQFLDANNGYVVGISGSMYKTSNGGENWIRVNIPTAQWLYALSFLDNQNGWVAGGNVNTGVIFHTTDGGNSWNLEFDERGQWLYGIKCINTTKGWAVGYNGQIYYKNYDIPYIPEVPVELTSFTGKFDQTSVLFSWATATEKNNKGFSLERKIGNNWQTIAFIEGKGTSTEAQNYFFRQRLENVSTGTLTYRLKQVDFDGSYKYSDEVNVSVIINQESLDQNYPNPFNSSAKVSYSIVRASHVTIKLYDILGREISVLVNEFKSPGRYTLDIDGSNLASGTYIYKIQTENFSTSKKLILLK